LPERIGDGPWGKFDKRKAELEAVREARDDEAALEKLSRRGDPMARALAGLLRFYHDPELPAMVVARYPAGEIPFAPFGRTTREANVAIQNADDPGRLMIGYLDWARKGFYFFATERTLYCTGRSPNPPAAFLAAQNEAQPYRLSPAEDGDLYRCPHLTRGDHRPFVTVGWPSAHREWRVCLACAKAERQLLATLTSRLTVPKPLKEFTVSADLNVECHGGSTCVHASLPGLPRGMRKRYLFGRSSDRELLDAYLAFLEPRLERTRAPVFVAAGVCYGSDRGKFIDGLAPTEEERTALDRTLPAVSGLFVIDEPRASRALERLWPDHADEIVGAIVSEPKEAERLVREARAAPGRVSELLARAARKGAEDARRRELPAFRNLVPEAVYVDGVARSFRARGAAAAEKTLTGRLPREGKERGLAVGLLAALDRLVPHEWQFTEPERKFGDSLAGPARELLTGPSAGYYAAMDRLLGLAGVVNWGELETNDAKD
ncbi:MAG: hypothetical protein L3K05_05240, partial [Thermoplasmata archaeon]|nr:hypothetical protein [Thermoplasmata archaeon]